MCPRTCPDAAPPRSASLTSAYRQRTLPIEPSCPPRASLADVRVWMTVKSGPAFPDPLSVPWLDPSSEDFRHSRDSPDVGYDWTWTADMVAQTAMSNARRPRILLIDDDPSVREVLLHLLASFGYDCQTAPDGPSGLARFDEGGWDLVLIDVVMPAMSGWGVVETIRRRAPTLPIVLITGMNEPAVMRRARDWRLPVIVKPFRSDTVREVVGTALPAKLV